MNRIVDAFWRMSQTAYPRRPSSCESRHGVVRRALKRGNWAGRSSRRPPHRGQGQRHDALAKRGHDRLRGGHGGVDERLIATRTT